MVQTHVFNTKGAAKLFCCNRTIQSVRDARFAVPSARVVGTAAQTRER